MNRRELIAGLMSCVAAPAIVRAEILAPLPEWIPALPNDLPELWDMRLLLRDTNRFRYLGNGD